MGQMLEKTDRAKGTKGQLKGRDASGSHLEAPPENGEPTLKEIGLTKRESAEAQALAELPDEDFEKIKDREGD